MGHAFLYGNGGDGKKLPVLNESYPENITVTAGDNATFMVLFDEEGKPADYTYTWYVNGSVVEDAKYQNYIRDTSDDKGVLTVYCEVTNKAGTVTSRTASLILLHNLTVNTNPGATVEATTSSDAVSATANASGVATLALKDGSWTITATSSGASSSATVTMDSHKNISLIANNIPAFTYTGSYKITDDGGSEISGSSGNWKIKFLTSGTLKFTSLYGAENGIDVFCVGGGGGGGYNATSDSEKNSGGGAGGGYTKTSKGISVTTDTSYPITIGAGGSGTSSKFTKPTAGGVTSAFGVSASGGDAGGSAGGGSGGSGGGAQRCNGGSNGGSGGTYSGTNNAGGSGQGTTTREFGESSGTLYAGGGGGADYYGTSGMKGGSGGGGNAHGNGGTNTGGGGGGGVNSKSGDGGSGIVVIRNKR